MAKSEFQPTGLRFFESIVRKAANKLGFSDRERLEMLRSAHFADNFIADTSTGMSVGGQGLDGIITRLEWLIDVIRDPVVKEEWQRLYRAECQKPEHKSGLNALEDWKLREAAFKTVQSRKQQLE